MLRSWLAPDFENHLRQYEVAAPTVLIYSHGIGNITEWTVGLDSDDLSVMGEAAPLVADPLAHLQRRRRCHRPLLLGWPGRRTGPRGVVSGLSRRSRRRARPMRP